MQCFGGKVQAVSLKYEVREILMHFVIKPTMLQKYRKQSDTRSLCHISGELKDKKSHFPLRLMFSYVFLLCFIRVVCRFVFPSPFRVSFLLYSVFCSHPILAFLSNASIVLSFFILAALHFLNRAPHKIPCGRPIRVFPFDDSIHIRA